MGCSDTRAVSGWISAAAASRRYCWACTSSGGECSRLGGVDSIGGIPTYMWLRNGAFMGLPFVALGDWIRRNQVRLTERLTK